MRILSIILLFSFFLQGNSLIAQTRTTQFNFEAGEVLDILLIEQQPNTDDLLSDYFKTAFPVAKEWGYRPLTGYSTHKLTAGNHMPSSFIFGKWTELAKREAFITEVTKAIPDFHDRRRAIWSYFGLTYYEIKEDLSYELQEDKFNVVTAVWKHPEESLQTYRKEWANLVSTHGGEVVLSLTDGKSPVGYYFQPDLLLVTAWKSEAAFNVFWEKHQATSHAQILHLNQFSIF